MPQISTTQVKTSNGMVTVNTSECEQFISGLPKGEQAAARKSAGLTTATKAPAKKAPAKKKAAKKSK